MPRGKPCAPGCTCARHDSSTWARGNPNAAKQRYAQAHPLTREQRRAIHLKHRFNLTLEQWDEMVAAQGGACYLCDEPLDLESTRKVHVDHDHSCCRGDKTCGRCIRGLACDLCNRGIGAFGDDPDRMERVAARLRAASAGISERRESEAAQGELPANVRRIERRKESA